MGRPTKIELASAFEQADSLKKHRIDRGHLAKSLYALSTQINGLENVLSTCESYLRSGQSVTDHRKIISAINACRTLDSAPSITENELECALSIAAKMREHDDDPDHIAKAILNFNYLKKHLQKVCRSAERYFYSGMQSSTLRDLESSIKNYHAVESRTSGLDTGNVNIF
ncbi:MAG: hypothetical protein GXP08_01925 [Gammaproteobacteria bacterium]|nr:hypothetical protein [Gammaproteobacteria bacterium]